MRLGARHRLQERRSARHYGVDNTEKKKNQSAFSGAAMGERWHNTLIILFEPSPLTSVIYLEMSSTAPIMYRRPYTRHSVGLGNAQTHTLVLPKSLRIVILLLGGVWNSGSTPADVYWWCRNGIQTSQCSNIRLSLTEVVVYS